MQPQLADTARVVSLTVVAMIAFAANSLLCRAALSDTAIDAASFTGIRLLAGAIALAVLLGLRGGRPLGGGTWRAGAMLFAYAAGFSFAYRDLTAATGALLLFGAVQTTMIGYGFARGDRLRPLQVAGLIAALAELGVLLLPGVAAPPLLGATCMIAAGIAWGVYSLLGRGAHDPVEATAGNFLRAVPFAVALSVATLAGLNLDTRGVVYAIVSGAITSGLGYVVWSAVLPRLKAASAATIQLSVPVIATLGGALLLAEPVTGRLIVAAATIVGGIALVVRGR